MEYSEYRHFLPVIKKAKEECLHSGQKLSNHFEVILDMITIGKTAQRKVESLKLSRYACLLIVQNADPSKTLISIARDYFSQQRSLVIPDNHKILKAIHTINGQQVMLDKDLAELYQTDTRTLKQTVRRNLERFPFDFMFELTEVHIDTMVSQFVIPSKSYFGGTKPFAFTEQGIAMLSAVLRTQVAVEVSLQIMRAFIEIRKQTVHNNLLTYRLDRVELKLLETDQRIEQVFKALEDKNSKPNHGIFYNGQIFDAYNFISDLIRKANTSLILIDNYIDDSVLTILNKRKEGVIATIYTSKISKELTLDIKKHNQQYPAILIKTYNQAHDRFLIIDEKELYHIGASLKDLGKKWFGFSRMDSMVKEVMGKLGNEAM